MGDHEFFLPPFCTITASRHIFFPVVVAVAFQPQLFRFYWKTMFPISPVPPPETDILPLRHITDPPPSQTMPVLQVAFYFFLTKTFASTTLLSQVFDGILQVPKSKLQLKSSSSPPLRNPYRIYMSKFFILPQVCAAPLGEPLVFRPHIYGLLTFFSSCPWPNFPLPF